MRFLWLALLRLLLLAHPLLPLLRLRGEGGEDPFASGHLQMSKLRSTEVREAQQQGADPAGSQQDPGPECAGAAEGGRPQQRNGERDQRDEPAACAVRRLSF